MGSKIPACLLLLGLIAYSPLVWCDESKPNEEEVASPNEQAQVVYNTPNVDGQYIYEHFDDSTLFANKWIKSSASKADSEELKYDGEWERIVTQAPFQGKYNNYYCLVLIIQLSITIINHYCLLICFIG